MFENEEVNNDVRLCYSCDKELPLDKFFKDGFYKDGSQRYRRDCKDCYKKVRQATKKPKIVVAPKRRKRR